MKNKNFGFTLVELIVVITILAILSTLGFVAYTDYLRGVRDSNRIGQISEIQKALTLYGTRSRLPIPENSISITSGVNKIGLQGDASQSILDTIKFTDGGVDPKTKEFFTYFISENRKYSQVLGFFEEKNKELSFSKSTYALEDDYSSLYPRVVGAELGILLQIDTQIPVQKLDIFSSGSLDIFNTSEDFLSFVNDSIVSTGSGVSLIGMVPNLSCKKIKEFTGVVDDGVYKINQTGQRQEDVYCNMTADGGGWTLAGFVDEFSSNDDVSFNSAIGYYDVFGNNENATYMLDASALLHTEMLFLYDTRDISEAESTDNLLHFKYDIFTPGFYIGPLNLPNGSSFFGSGGDETGLSYSTTVSGPMIPTNRDRFGSAGWGIGSNSPDIPYLIRLPTSKTGFFKYPEVWGGSSIQESGHNVYIYVR